MIIIAFILFDRESYLTLIASLVGVTSLIFNAKGNPFGQFLMIIFSILYGIISCDMAYYGEMITYLGMTAPMALYALIAWLRNPFNGNKAEVEVNRLKPLEYIIMTIMTLIVTWVFYYVLVYFNTANIVPSTISVTTSFIAVYLTARRSEYYALGYAANDIVLIVLWIMATIADIKYISVITCFVAFLFNDLYGYVNWRKMKKRQDKE
jgi:nicotinamide mononucleotide transporter PnuC